MAKIKIISDPYKREITFESFHAPTDMWESIGERNPDSRLREDESGKSFLPFKIKEIIDTIIHDYRTGTERVEIVFEGTNEEYREVEKVCLSEGVADKVVLTRTHRILENARSILKDTKGIFRNVEPIIAKIVKDDAAVCGDLKKVSDALDDIIPICVFGKRQKELDAKRSELITTIGENSSEHEFSFVRNSKTHIRSYVKNELDYSYEMQELDDLDDGVAAKYAEEAHISAHEHGFEKAKGTMWNHLKSHGQNLFSKEFRQVIIYFAPCENNKISQGAFYFCG